jgi:hypothetical protein
MRAHPALTLLFCFAPVVFGGSVNLGSFSVSGSGTFSCDQLDATAEFTFSLSGANQNYSLLASSNGLGGSSTFTSHLTFPCFGSTVGENTTIGDTLPPDFDISAPVLITVTPLAAGGFSASTDAGMFQVGNGTGYLDVYDSASAQPGNPANLIAVASLTGYVTVNSVQSFGQPDPSANGTFVITPASPTSTAPEPASAMLVLMAALWPAAGAAAGFVRRRIRNR